MLQMIASQTCQYRIYFSDNYHYDVHQRSSTTSCKSDDTKREDQALSCHLFDTDLLDHGKAMMLDVKEMFTSAHSFEDYNLTDDITTYDTLLHILH